MLNNSMNEVEAVPADFARELERELAACVPGMELIARMLSDERALADRLAASLDTLLAGYDDAKEIACFTVAEEHTASRAIEAWKEARRGSH